MSVIPIKYVYTKDWLARNQDHVSAWVDTSIRGLLFQGARTINI